MANLLDQILANLGNFGKDAKKNVVNPTVQEAKKIYNTAQAPVTGLVGAASAGADKAFNGGKNYQNLLNATKLQLNQNINRSLVPQAVAQGKATPLQFGQSFTKTGVELAPYAIGGAGGALTKTLGKTVAGKVGENLLGRAAGQTARIGANAAISAPTFAGLNSLQQGVDSGFRQFDAGQANITGLQAGAMTAAGDLAPIVAKGLAKGTKAAGKASVQAVDDATRAVADKTTDKIASTLGQNRGIHQNNFEPSLVNIAKPEDIKAANKYIQQASKGKDIGSITTTLNKDGYAEPATKQGLQKYLAYKKLYETGVEMNPATNDFGGAAVVDRPFKDVPVNHIDENTLRDGLSAYRMQREGGYIGVGNIRHNEDPEFASQFINQQVASHSSPDDFLDNTVDSIWKAEKKGQGVDFIQNDMGAGVTDTKRISNNSPFYQAFYQEYGKPPTKAAIKDMADQLYAGKKGQYDSDILAMTMDPREFEANQAIYAQLKDRGAAQEAKLADKSELFNRARQVNSSITRKEFDKYTPDQIKTVEDNIKRHDKITAESASRYEQAKSNSFKTTPELGKSVTELAEPYKTAKNTDFYIAKYPDANAKAEIWGVFNKAKGTLDDGRETLLSRHNSEKEAKKSIDDLFGEAESVPKNPAQASKALNSYKKINEPPSLPKEPTRLTESLHNVEGLQDAIKSAKERGTDAAYIKQLQDRLRTEKKSLLPAKEVPKRPNLNQYKKKARAQEPTPIKADPNAKKYDNLKDYVKDQVKDQRTATKASTKEKLTKFLDSAKHSLVDDATAYERYIKDKPTRQNLREGVDRVRSSSVIAKQFVEDNGFKKLGKMKVNDLDEFQQYLIAKRAKELEARGVTTGRNQTMDSALVKQVGDKYKGQEKIVRDYSRTMLDYSVDHGMISKELRDKLVKESPDYVPMNRIFDELEAKGIHKSKQLGSLSKQSVVQKIKGSERTVDNPIESMIKNTERMINEGERNNVARQIAGHDSFKGRVLKEGEKPQPGNDTLSWLENGEKHQVEVPELVAREMKNLNGVIPGYLDTALKVAGFPTKLLRSGATTANPVFAASNVIRDQLQTTITGSIKANIKGTPKAFSAAFLPGKEANALRAEMSRNGIIGNQYRQTYGYKSGQLIKELKANSEIDGIAWEKIKHPIDAVADLIGRTEYFTRAQQFYGTAGDLAAKSQAARNNTLNFGRGGVLVRELNKVIPFINAGVQGGRITVNQLHDRPVRTLAAFGTFTGLALAAKAFNQQQNADLYNRLSDEEKKNNLIIFGPDAHYDGNENKVVGITKIPMPQMLYPLLDGVNNVKGKPEDIMRIAGDTFTAITGLDATNPINQLTPTFAKPAVEIGLNKSTYSGQDIISDYEKNNNPEDMGANYSSGLARTIAKGTGIPAPDIDNVISNYGGGLAKDLTKALSNNPDNAKDGGGIASLFDQGFTRRFMTGAVTSQYDIQAGLAQGYKKQLKNDPSFTSLSKDDQTKVLDKVDSDTKAIAGIAAKTEQNKTDDIKKDLSARQKSLLSDGFNASTYLKDATATTTTKSASSKLSPSLDSTSKSVLSQYSKLSTDDRSKKFYSDPSAEYQYDLAKYKNDSANGTLTKTQDIKQQTSLAKEKVGSQFDKNTRDIYNGLSASQLYQYASTDPDGNNIVKKVLAYGDALDSAGVSTNKFRTSKGAVNIKGKASGSASSSKKASKASYKPASNTALLSAYKAAKGAKIKKTSTSVGGKKAKGLIAYKKPAQAKQFKA